MLIKLRYLGFIFFYERNYNKIQWRDATISIISNSFVESILALSVN